MNEEELGIDEMFADLKEIISTLEHHKEILTAAIEKVVTTKLPDIKYAASLKIALDKAILIQALEKVYKKKSYKMENEK